ncbi:FkbM family methyltransferase [Allochromatium palmeri]|uniref:FkbM family methyltransferase n=1 Tax=Allochromatium palmeri TaxID=231048 RepID=UPI0016432FAB
MIDVGVNFGTPELISAFPKAKHYLFEPMEHFRDPIASKYQSLEHELFCVALSDRDYDAWLVEKNVAGGNSATHSQILEKPVDVDGKNIIKCSPMEIRRFDSLSITVDPNFLLKIDVDGKDLEVLLGFGEHLKRASVIIIEATFATLGARLRSCQEAGFQLWDIVDLVYYGPALYQCDLIFVRNPLAVRMRPPISNFDKGLWEPFR